MAVRAAFAVVSAITLFALFTWRLGWRRTLLLTLPCWLVLNIAAAVLLDLASA